MAEAILTEIGKDIGIKILEKLSTVAYKKIMSVKDREYRIERLRQIKDIIAAELHKFDSFEVSNDLEGKRIQKLRHIRDELVYFLEEQDARNKQKEVMTSAEKSLLFFSPFIIDNKVNALMEKLRDIANDIDLCRSIVSHSCENQNNFTSSAETSPFPLPDVFIGRDRDKENIVNMIYNSSNDHIVAIIGVGGQGKTTLAQFVCQDDRVKGSFDKRLWVSLTPKSPVNEILQKIIISATGEKPIYCGLEQLHLQVLQAIDGKKCLLVLDNVYYVKNLRDDSEALRAILKQGCFWRNGGKVLITSRSEKVAEQMRTPKPYKLRDLEEDDCWMLLRHYAIKHEKKKEDGVEEIGKEIARICPKMPLVLKTIGCYLADKDYKCQWEHFRKELDSNPTSYIEQQEKIKQTLKLCYDQLDHNLKRCAAFCSIFPKGHVYDKNYMVRNWIALGLVESRVGMSLEDVGDSYVLELTQRAFFDEAGKFEVFKMHDVMHDLMLLIGKGKHQMIDSKTKNIVAEEVRHVALDIQDSNWEVLLSSISGKQTLIESILLVSTAWDKHVHGVPLGSGIDKLILACQKLKVLEIYWQRIQKVPESIGELTLMTHLNLSGNLFCKLPNGITKMVNLLTLDLSDCRNLQELPTKIGKLKNLLSLDLAYCWELEELPREMGKLVNLRHLWIEGCRRLRCMPKGFGNLRELETLDVFVVGKSTRGLSKANGAAKLEELGHLKNLKGNLRIEVATKSKYMVSEAGNVHVEIEAKLQRLRIEFKQKSEKDKKFLEVIRLSGGENLKELYVGNYGGKGLPLWMTDDRFHERFPKLDSFKLGRTLFTPIFMNNDDKDESIGFAVGGNEEDIGEWVPKYSRIKERLKIGSIELSFRTRRRDGLTLTDVREDVTLDNVWLLITDELASRSGSGSGCGGQRQPDILLKSCFPNLTRLDLWGIPELEVLPEEFQGLSSLKDLSIKSCPKLKGIPDWIDTLSSLEDLLIWDATEVKVLPDSIGSLTSLRRLSLSGCTGLEVPPHQISKSCSLDIGGCSKALYKKCLKPKGEYWLHLQHLRDLCITSSEGDKFRYECEEDDISNEEDDISDEEDDISDEEDTSEALMIPNPSNDVAAATPPLTLIVVPTTTHPNNNSLLIRNALFSFFVVVVIVLVVIYYFV